MHGNQNLCVNCAYEKIVTKAHNKLKQNLIIQISVDHHYYRHPISYNLIYMKDSVKSAHATNWVNVPEKNKKSPIVPGKLLPASRVLCRSDAVIHKVAVL